MPVAENKQLLQHIFDGLARGDSRPLVDAMADDFTWTVIGTTAWSGTYRGKKAVLRELLGPLSAQFADTYTNTAQRYIAEDDHVVVECRGRVTATDGSPYHNTYCWVCRVVDGSLLELTEYCDTQLIATTLGVPS